MLDPKKIPHSILENLHDRGLTDEQIADMSPKEAFGEYAQWHGLINWGSTLWHAVESFKAAEVTDDP